MLDWFTKMAFRYCMVTYNILTAKLDEALVLTPGLTSPTVISLGDKEWTSVTAMTLKKESGHVMDKLEDLGATGISIMPISNCRC